MKLSVHSILNVDNIIIYIQFLLTLYVYNATMLMKDIYMYKFESLNSEMEFETYPSSIWEFF